MTDLTRVWSVTVALTGNPNTGKSTLFNRLTGASQKVGNYPGVTVEKMVGELTVGDLKISIVDLPGTYSLAPASADEQVVLDVLIGRIEGTPQPDAVICVADATQLRRNLFLPSQIAETGVPVILALNLMDAAEAQGIRIDTDLLSKRLGIPVVPTVAIRGEGSTGIWEALARTLDKPGTMAPVPWPEAVQAACRKIREAVGPDAVEAEVHRILFDMESELARKIDPAVLEAARAILKEAEFDPTSVEAELRYKHIDTLLKEIVRYEEAKRPPRTSAIDRVLTHRFFGLIIFGALMYLVFASIYWLAGPFMDGIDAAFAWIGEAVAPLLESMPILQSLVVDGIIAGVGGVVIFLPQILILFLFIAVLEDSGYMARAAFLMDKVFSWCGLNGKSFVPMLSSFACAVPAIMGTRTIEDPRARLTTILVSPLMSCSARLPVYVLLIGAFIEPVYGALWAGVALFAMHILGLFVAIPIAFLINRFLLRTRPLPFVLEMPPYRRPRVRDVFWRMFRNGREFVAKAGTIILAFSVVIWALMYFPRPDSVREELAASVAAERGITAEAALALLDEELAPRLDGAYVEQSFMGRAGKTVQPLFALAGFDWKITVGVLASFPAREVIISTLGIIYTLDETEIEEAEESPVLRERLAGATWSDGSPVYTPLVAIAIMVFFAFCMQCGATVAIVARESGWTWATFSFVYMTGLAWLGAVAVYQIGSLL